jgi:hypothetical protein
LCILKEVHGKDEKNSDKFRIFGSFKTTPMNWVEFQNSNRKTELIKLLSHHQEQELIA